MGERFWSISRLNRLSVSVLIGISIGLAIFYVTDTRDETLLSSGDFPGFYAPAVIVARGLQERLYDQRLQQAVENEFWPGFNGAYYSSVYPPYVALMLRPLAYLDHRDAKNLTTVLLFLLLVWSIRLISKVNTHLIGRNLIAVAFCLSFAPVFYGIVAAQNTAISACIYAGALYAFSKCSKRGDFAAGILLGLWLFKPQFGLFGLLFAAIGGRGFALIGASLPALAYYLMGVSVLGPDWFFEWFNAVSEFSKLNIVANRQQMVSIVAFFEAVKEPLVSIGISARLTDTLVVLVSISIPLSLFILFGWQKQKSLFFQVLLGPVIALISPQTLFYDLGIPLVSCAICFKGGTDREVNGLLLLLIAVIYLTLYRELFPVPPLFFVGLGMLVFTVRHGRQNALQADSACFS